MPTAEALIDRILPVVRSRLPPGVTPAYFDVFIRRNRAALVAVLARQLAARNAADPPADRDLPAQPDLWSAAQRTAANLAAMQLAARKRPDEMTAADRATLAAYSGWGGLSIEGAARQFPIGFPAPEPRGLIHEYYTPTRVAREVARVIHPLLPDLPRVDGALLALEPSAGIGRFVQAASGPGFDALRWLVVEWSELSSPCAPATFRPCVSASGTRSPSGATASSAASRSANRALASAGSGSHSRSAARHAGIDEQRVLLAGAHPAR